MQAISETVTSVDDRAHGLVVGSCRRCRPGAGSTKMVGITGIERDMQDQRVFTMWRMSAGHAEW